MLEKIKDYIGISFWDTIYKYIVFGDFFIATIPFFQKRKIKKVRALQEKLASSLKKKDVIKVVFFLQHSSVWKYDSLYNLLEKSERFEPLVVIAPFNVHLIYDKDECFKVMEKAELFAKSKGYRYMSSYDYAEKRWVDVKKVVSPDIVFFSKPYKDTVPSCHLYKFLDCLTLYVPYGIMCLDIYRIDYNLPFHNLLWKFIVETKYQKIDSQNHSLCKSDNVMVGGALGVEKLIDERYCPKDVWKPQKSSKKRIVWAPHHTVDYLFNFSNFLSYCDFMIELAEKYSEQVQFAFKPHPVLKFKLINIWGKEKTEAYYQRWASLDNGQVEEGEYIDLFKTSDALIHDCVSFMAEYLYTKKPVLFMVKNEEVMGHLNQFGKKCIENHYISKTKEDIESFISTVVIEGKDTMVAQRTSFLENTLCPNPGLLPSQIVFNQLAELL